MAVWKFTSTLKIFTSTHAFKSLSPKWHGKFGWNFVWSISRTLMLIGIKIKKNITELGHSDCLNIYVNPSKIYINLGIQVHSKPIQMTYSLKPLHPWILNFICSMIRLQGFRIIKFSWVENSRWPPLLKIAKLIKSSFSSELLGIFGWNFVWNISRTLMLIDIKMKKKSVAELGHNGHLKIYVNPEKSYVDRRI